MDIIQNCDLFLLVIAMAVGFSQNQDNLNISITKRTYISVAEGRGDVIWVFCYWRRFTEEHEH